MATHRKTHLPTLTITIREATLADLPHTTSIVLRAFANDDLSHLLYPPHLVAGNSPALYASTYTQHRLRLLSPDRVYLVALAPSDPTKSTSCSRPKIVGTACWHRRRPVTNPESNSSAKPGPRYSYPSDTFLKRLELRLTQATDSLSWALFPHWQPDITNHAGLAAYLSVVEAAEREIYNTPALQERWELEDLAVDPAYQGMSVGGRLVEWGCQRADEEGVGCSLEASRMGMGVYLRMGFVVVREEVVVCGETGGRVQVTLMKRRASGE